MEHDQHGNPTTGGTAAVALYDRATDALLRFSPDVITAAGTMVEESPDAPMGHALVAYLYLTSTDTPDVAVARGSWVAMASLELNERERGHHDAIGAWLDGDWVRAAAVLDDVSTRWPADTLALQVGHQLDFFLGDAANLRDRPARALLDLDPEHPHTAFVHGMVSFGAEELNDYGAAEAHGHRALAVNPDDVWAVHAVTHVHEMQGRVDEGIRFLLDRRADWGTGNLFTAHNWWHLAVFLLEAGRVDDALAIYDAEVHNAASDGIPLEMVDASALLWRLYLDGEPTGGRFAPLADAWATRLGAPSWYVFNDVHLVATLAGADRLTEAEAHVDALAAQVAAASSGRDDSAGTNDRMAAVVGLPASRAVLRFAQDRHDEVVDLLLPIRRRYQVFGGSHAQRDLLQRTLLESALRSGRHDLARALLSERLTMRDTSVYGWTQRARLLRAEQDGATAGEAQATADALRQRFAAAVRDQELAFTG